MSLGRKREGEEYDPGNGRMEVNKVDAPRHQARKPSPKPPSVDLGYRDLAAVLALTLGARTVFHRDWGVEGDMFGFLRIAVDYILVIAVRVSGVLTTRDTVAIGVLTLGWGAVHGHWGMWLLLAFMWVGIIYGFIRWTVVIPYVLARWRRSLQEWRQEARLWGWTLCVSLLSIALFYGASLWYRGTVFRAHLATVFPIYGLIAGLVSLLALLLYSDALMRIRRQERLTAARGRKVAAVNDENKIQGT